MPSDFGGRALNMLDDILPRHTPPNTDEQLHAVLCDGDGFDQPIPRPTLVTQVPLAESGGSGYFE